MKGNLVRTIRHYKGMTQPQFSKWLGVAESTIAQVEAGHRNVSENLASKIALKFDVTNANFIAYRERREQTSNYFLNVN
ncbi:helix-turn-helix transcriptional regulator [Pseudogracilibacillus sp. SE30717A]|uniref:helix-turn-helix transcriptional regulator n=1 Tax=Pseudogracilibacillus sp. SE30717A TaxID=3098293 RepID=UPI00300E39EC